MEPAYKRVLVKLSGEALGIEGRLFDFDMIGEVAKVLSRIARAGVQIGLVIGGGNIWRGRETEKAGARMNRALADHMGMLGTVLNALAMQDALLQQGQPARVMSAIPMTGVTEPFFFRDAIEHLQNGEIVIFAGGTGDPFHSTDTAAAQRAAEIEADALLMAKNVNGIYEQPPIKNPKANMITNASYQDIIDMQQKNKEEAIDTEALLICRKTKLPAMLVFELKNPEDIERIVYGGTPGTYLKA